MKLKLLVLGCLLVPALALADPTTAEEWYKEGANQYNLGNFDQAVDAFKKGFELAPDAKKPAYLYNIAQSYRQANDCKNAAFFYKRYLSLAEQDTVKPISDAKRQEVEGFIADEEKCAGGATTEPQPQPQPKPQPVVQQPQPKPQPVVQQPKPQPVVQQPQPKPQPVVQQPKPQPKVAANTGTTGDDDDDDTHDNMHKHYSGQGGPPHLIVARLTGGVGKISTGSLNVPWQATFNLFVGYPLTLMNGKLEIDAGVNAGYTAVPYENLMTFAKTNGSLISVLANASAAYTVYPNLDVRGDLGVGLLTFSGLGDPGNPFTNQGEPASGALAMFAVRAGVSADYAVLHNLLVTVTPFAIQYSPPPSGFRSDINAILNIDFMLGVGYRM